MQPAVEAISIGSRPKARATSDRKSIRLDRLVEFLAYSAGEIGSRARRIIEANRTSLRAKTFQHCRVERGLLLCLPRSISISISQLKSIVPLMSHDSRPCFLVFPRLASGRPSLIARIKLLNGRWGVVEIAFVSFYALAFPFSSSFAFILPQAIIPRCRVFIRELIKLPIL